MLSVSKSTGKPWTSKWGFSVMRWQFATPQEKASMLMHLMSPAVPAAASKWPMLVFALVFRIGAWRLDPMTPRRAPTSMGSPRAVPVPWHSAIVISLGESPPSRIELLMTSCCEGPCGAVMLALRPSWFAQHPISIARRSIDSTELLHIFSLMPPTPSPRAKPSADWSKVKHLPFEVSMPGPLREMYAPTPMSVFVPITKPCWRSVLRFGVVWSSCCVLIVICATEQATREEEQAVSAVLTGPFRPMM
mmetsp:Transcript_2326/g.6543  ORF Transcript_2326/g.6543 Transcript_2326/m.6543 type:complete len:248 (+) Transcript_2326:305-1048(+)